MSNMHVQVQSGGKYRIVLHIAVPVGNNSATPPVPWRTALVASGIGGKTVLVEGTTPGTISTAERAGIADGSVLEEVVEWDVTRGGLLVGQAILTYMDQLYALKSAERLQALQIELAHFGRVQP